MQMRKSSLAVCVLVILGLLALYLPMYSNLASKLWSTDEQAHGPIIIMVVAYLIWLRRDFFKDPWQNVKRQPLLGFLFIIPGLVFYVLGRSQDIWLFDVGSQIPVLLGLLLLLYGTRGAKTFWFPLFFLFFMIPLPGAIIDAVTMPMKISVSYVAEYILYGIGYPIARSGVILQIGQYQLLVADACAGLHTLMSLEALGLLYLNIVRSDSVFRNVSLAILIVPISFTANVIRVMTLTLITYYFGDAAGQGFMHGFAGMLLFVVALILILWVDIFLSFLERKWRTPKSQPGIAK